MICPKGKDRFLSKRALTLDKLNTIVWIHFADEWVEFFNDGSVSRIFQEDGVIHYFKEQPPTQYCTLHEEGVPLLDESFEEAAIKLKKIN